MRCFVACWPDDATRERLDRVARDQLPRYPGARRMRPENLHLTLAFIGQMAETAARELAAALAREVCQPFDWRIDHVGRFERARVLWAGGPEELRLVQWAERVRQLLQTMQVAFDRKPFAAHVTLLRDAPARRGAEPAEASEPIEPIRWPVQAARLIVSERDARGATRYRPLEPQ